MQFINTYWIRLIFLTAMLLGFQSCRTYKSQSQTLEIAANSNKRIKVKTINGQRVSFKRVIKKDGAYYGVKKTDKEESLIRLEADELEGIYIQKKWPAIVIWSLVGVFTSMFLLNAVIFGF